MYNNKKTEDLKLEGIILLILGIGILISLYSLNVAGGSPAMNVTVVTMLRIQNVRPEIINMTINENANIILNPNATKRVSCIAIIVDYNNETDIDTVTAKLFNSTESSPDDNNNHYTNSSCFINRNFVSYRGIIDDNYTALANCSFNVWYYANPYGWNCTAWVNDSTNLNSSNSKTINVSELLAVNLPDIIDYGSVSATYVSNEQIVNISNAGNVLINVSLDGYGVRRYDNLSMNCTLGLNKNISVAYEKYNFTESNPGALSLTLFEGVYKNLTSLPKAEYLGLRPRQEDTYDDAINSTYWRIYVPLGVAGNCSGNIVFGATNGPAAP